MWEPVGPLPAAVYWRRRWVAIGSTIGAILLVTWTMSALAARPETAPTRANHAAVIVSQQAEGPRFVVPDVAPPSAQGPSVSAQITSDAPVTTSEELRPDDTPRPSVPVPSPVPVPPTGPIPCSNATLAVAAEIDRAEHRVGERPVLRLVVTNLGDQPCVRDLDSARQEIVVWSRDLSTRLWSSNDCVNDASVDLRTLVPGRPVAFAVTWRGRTTEPGCPQARTIVPAGSYQVMTRVDDAISPPTPFARLA